MRNMWMWKLRLEQVERKIKQKLFPSKKIKINCHEMSLNIKKGRGM